MIEMNPYYANESPVGEVFDVATFSPGKSLWMAVVALLFAAAVGVAAAALWQPSLFSEYAPDLVKSLEKELKPIKKDYPWGVPAAAFCLSAFSLLCAMMCTSSITDLFRSDYYFRAGPGGLSLRVPNGISFVHLGLLSSVLELHLPWEKIGSWKITQTKQLGSMSANAGNVAARIDIRAGGNDYSFSLDIFSEPSRIIYNRIQQAQEMTVARLDEEPLCEVR